MQQVDLPIGMGLAALCEQCLWIHPVALDQQAVGVAAYLHSRTCGPTHVVARYGPSTNNASQIEKDDG